MRQRRLYGKEGGYYHVMSRAVFGMRIFGSLEKEVMRKILRKTAAFSGAEVLTYCVMENHFHLLVRVPSVQDLSDAELVRRYALLYNEPSKFQLLTPEQLRERLAAGGEEADRWRSKLKARMGDLSAFVKLFKQRFSIWYHAHHGTFGTLWSERFKSLLIEGRRNALATVAAYIDLNPVRAGLVNDPKDYRFCGYAEAVASREEALVGLCTVLGSKDVLREYRLLLFGQAAVPPASGSAPVDREMVKRVLEEEGGELPLQILLRCRVRYFANGLVLGSKEFMMKHLASSKGVASQHQKRLAGFSLGFAPEWRDLRILRQPRGHPFG